MPHTRTDDVARAFSLTPMQRPGIKLMLAPLHLFEGPYFRTLYRLSYRGRRMYPFFQVGGNEMVVEGD